MRDMKIAGSALGASRFSRIHIANMSPHLECFPSCRVVERHAYIPKQGKYRWQINSELAFSISCGTLRAFLILIRLDVSTKFWGLSIADMPLLEHLWLLSCSTFDSMGRVFLVASDLHQEHV